MLTNDTLARCSRAHAMGVQDALLALQIAIAKSGRFSPEIQAEILMLGQSLVVLPTRVLKELSMEGMEKEAPKTDFLKGPRPGICSYCGHPENSTTCQRGHP